MDLGFILIAFICSTPIDAPLGQHECISGIYGHYETGKSCIDAAIRLDEEITAAGGRIPEGACRTPISSDGKYYDLAVKKMGSV